MGHGLTGTLLLLAGSVLLAQPAAGERASLPDRYLGLRMQPLLLLTRADVRADIGIDGAQAEAVDRAVLDFVARAAATRNLPPGPGAVAARGEVDTDAQRWLASHLTAEQYQRLLQVDLQWEGPSCLISRSVIADHLGLRPEQRKRLSQALDERNRQRPPGTFSQEVEKVFAEKARAVLDPMQQHLWATMLGRRFTPRLAELPTPAAPSAR